MSAPPPEERLDPPVAGRVHDGEIVHLRVSDYRRPSGLVVRREVIDHPGAVVIVPVEGDAVLLVRQPREAVRERLLELPAGKKDRPGEDALECARRELAEEVGREARTWRDLGGFYTAPAILTEWIDCFLATDLAPSDVPPLPDEEIEVVPWPLADLPALLERGPRRQDAHRAATPGPRDRRLTAARPAARPRGDGVAAAADDQRAVDRDGDGEGQRQRDGQAPPEAAVGQAGGHRARDGQHGPVVHDLHDGDRDAVGGQGHARRGARGQPGRRTRPAPVRA